jgi:hypothetical protein
VENAGVSATVVPRFLPEGYIIMETNSEETYEGMTISALFSNGKEYIVLSYLISRDPDISRMYPIDDNEPEIMTVGNVEYYIVTNEAKYGAVWSTGNILCQISGVDDKEDLLNMLNSIYEEVTPP